jgi:hypothetical protein
MKPPLPLSKAEREAAILHRRIAHERAMSPAAEREAHLRKLMGLPAAPARPETDQGHEQ